MLSPQDPRLLIKLEINPQPNALVIGGGPAGLMAAEELAQSGLKVWVVAVSYTHLRAHET